jgi:hypothetical protein
LNFKRKFSIAAETLAAICMVAIMVVACGGGGGGSTSGVTQAYTASVGVGELLLRFNVNTANLTYSYSVLNSSSPPYTAQTGTGTLSSTNPDGSNTNPAGSYNVGLSSDGTILGGKVFPIANGVMVGHVALARFGSSISIPVFSISNPITALQGVDGVYNYQGFSCNATGIANVSGVSGCSSHLGTMLIAGSSSTEAVYADCNGGDISAASGCSSTPSTGRIVPSAGAAGVYDLRKAGIGHIGWFFAFTAPNGQVVGVIDHDDLLSSPNAYGFTVLSPHTPVAIGGSNGSYLVETNENQEQWVTISTTSTTASGVTTTSTIYTSTAQSGVPGTLTPNVPWDGLSTYYLPASGVSPAVSGVVMVTGTGAYTHSSINDTKLFAVGVRYGP